MGWLAALGQTSAGEAAVADTGVTAGEVATSQAAGAGIPAAETGAESAANVAPQAAASIHSMPEFNDIVNPKVGFTPSESDLGKVSSESLKGFQPYPSFLDNAASFGKDFGIQLSKQLIHGALSQVPGGRTAGTILSRSFDSPTLKNLFSNPDDEVTKRDDIIQMLLKQRLGRT